MTLIVATYFGKSIETTLTRIDSVSKTVNDCTMAQAASSEQLSGASETRSCLPLPFLNQLLLQMRYNLCIASISYQNETITL